MRYYPLFIDLTKWKCLVLGAGKVGRRKISTLLECNAKHILVLDKHLEESDFFTLFKNEYKQITRDSTAPQVTYQKRIFQKEDLDCVRIVFTATSDFAQNGRVAQLCQEKQILCNVIEDSTRGDCIVPSHITCEDLIIALSTSGSSPALAKVLKQDLNEWINQGYGPFLKFMDCIRKAFMNENFSHIDRTALFRTLVQSPLREDIMTCLVQGKKAQLLNILEKELPQEMLATSFIDTIAPLLDTLDIKVH